MRRETNWMKRWCLVILIVLLPCCQGCGQVKPKFTVEYSDAIFVVKDGRVVDQDGKEKSLSEIQGWYIISPGLVRKLYGERVSGD